MVKIYRIKEINILPGLWVYSRCILKMFAGYILRNPLGLFHWWPCHADTHVWKSHAGISLEIFTGLTCMQHKWKYIHNFSTSSVYIWHYSMYPSVITSVITSITPILQWDDGIEQHVYNNLK